MDSKLLDASVDFALKIIGICDKIKGHPSLANRLEENGTAIGAIVREASFLNNVDEYIIKLDDALKECQKTVYWIELLFKSDLISKTIFNELNYECESIAKMITSAITAAKENPNKSVIK